MSIESSYGPLGKKKILCNSNSIVISKESQYLTNTLASNSVHSFLNKQAVEGAIRRGDGVLSESILFEVMIRGIGQTQFEDASPQHLVTMSLAMSTIHTVVQSLKQEIAIYLTNANIWHVETGLVRRIVSLCHTTAQASTNVTTANTIIHVLEMWLLGVGSTESTLLSKLRSTLDNFDTLVLVSTGKLESARNKKDFLILPADRIIISGRCSDFSMLSHIMTSVPMQLLCVKQLGPLSGGSATSSADKIVFTIEQASALNLMRSESYKTKPVYNLVELLRDSLEEGGFALVLCSERVNDFDRSIFTATANIAIMDCVPLEMLQYVSSRSGCSLADDANDVSRLRNSNKLHVGTLTHVERALLGGRNEVQYVLCGVGVRDNKPHELEKSRMPSQVVLCGPSVLSAGVLVNMLKRCLTVALYSLGEGRKSILSSPVAAGLFGVSSSQMSPKRTSPSPIMGALAGTACCVGMDTKVFNLSAVVIPGGGAGELGWSLMWSQIAQQLRLRGGRARPGVVGSSSSGSCNSAGECTLFEEKVAPIVELIASALIQRLPSTASASASALKSVVSCRGTTSGSQRVYNACITLCELLSAAYMTLPELLMHRAHIVLSESDLHELFEHSNNSRPSSHSNHNSNTSYGNNRISSSSRRSLFRWKDSFCRHSASSGRIGIICNCDSTALEVCTLADGIQSGVYSSYFHFWDGFSDMIGLVRTYLRVGGEAGMIPIRGRLKLAHLACQEEEDDLEGAEE